MASKAALKQLEKVQDVIDLRGVSKKDINIVEDGDIISILQNCGAIYAGLLVDEINSLDIASSGKLAGSIQPLDVAINGNVYTVEIEAKNYAQFVSQGVNGWANSRGSKFSFKRSKGSGKSGDFSQSPMVKRLEEYIRGEGLAAANVKVAISERERKGQKMLPPTTKAAMKMAYMIKRQGIKPTNFWEAATQRAIPIIADEIGKQYKVSIINYLVK